MYATIIAVKLAGSLSSDHFLFCCDLSKIEILGACRNILYHSLKGLIRSNLLLIILIIATDINA